MSKDSGGFSGWRPSEVEARSAPRFVLKGQEKKGGEGALPASRQ